MNWHSLTLGCLADHWPCSWGECKEGELLSRRGPLAAGEGQHLCVLCSAGSALWCCGSSREPQQGKGWWEAQLRIGACLKWEEIQIIFPSLTWCLDLPGPLICSFWSCETGASSLQVLAETRSVQSQWTLLENKIKLLIAVRATESSILLLGFLVSFAKLITESAAPC